MAFPTNTVSRRRFFAIGGAAAALAAGAPLLSSCSGSGSQTGSGSKSVGPNTEAQLVLTSWNIPADITAYKKLAAAYKRKHPKVSIKVQVTPNGDFNQYLSTQLAGGHAPDIIRNTWQQIGRWAQNGGFMALDDYLEPNYGADFGSTFWQASQHDGKTYGIPQHTDTFGTYYHKDIMSAVGARIPKTLEDAWTWDEFLNLARKVKSQTGKAALAYGFEGTNTAYRWLPFLYMHGGKLLEDDLKTPAINNQQGVEAITWFQSLYKEGLIPRTNTIKGSTTAAVENLFTTGQVGLMIWGDWILSQIAQGLSTSKWDITYMPKDASAASDLGGNLLSVSKDCKSPAVAADFIQFVCNAQNMETFCETDLFLPVRKSLSNKPLDYHSEKKQMTLFARQATTVPASMAKVETSPDFAAINQVLADQLDLCFTGQQTPQKTAAAIQDGVAGAVS